MSARAAFTHFCWRLACLLVACLIMAAVIGWYLRLRTPVLLGALSVIYVWYAVGDLLRLYRDLRAAGAL